MSRNTQFAISPITAAVSAALTIPAVGQAQNNGADGNEGLEEVIVTATKREMSLQNIAKDVQAIPEAMLREIGALNTEDYVRIMPAVTWLNFNSAGDNSVIFRGVNTTTSGFIATQSSSVYLDEIPITSTSGSQPNIRMMDIERVEALAGPQGTLFGAAAQAGTLRVISNRPDVSEFSASTDFSIRTGSESDVSHSLTGVINLPLVEDVFAIRIAAQSAEDGGYIDNVLGHTPDTWWGFNKNNTDPSASGPWQGPQTDGFWASRQEWGTRDNSSVAEENWNDAEYLAARIGARWNINEDWSATLTYHYGDTQTNGSNDFNPFVGDLETVAFTNNSGRDEWDMFSLEIEADLGFAQLVSATSFFEREYTYSYDRTLYFKYYHAAYCEHKPDAAYYYWLWTTPNQGQAVYYPRYCPMPLTSASGDPTQQADFIGAGSGPEWQDRFTQEIRLSAQGERFDWLAGLYYEDSSDNWDAVWMASPDPYQQSMSYAYMDSVYGGDVSKSEAMANGEFLWTSMDRTTWEQQAVFGEVTWHISDALHLTVGGRWFDTTNTKTYTKMIMNRRGADGRVIGGWTQPNWVGNDIPVEGSVSEFVPKVALTWNLSDSKMVYGSYTEGYRTGGVNRTNKNADWTRTLFPQTWDPDKLKNYEIGLRTRWADNSLQVNATAFYMAWDDFQTEVVDPSYNECRDPSLIAPDCGPPINGLSARLPWLSIVGNSGDASIKGFSAHVDWIPADGWDVGANLTYLEGKIDKGPAGIGGSGIVPGLRLPNVPELQGAAWATYRWPVSFVDSAEMFIRGDVSYRGDTHTALVPRALDNHSPSFDTEPYTYTGLRVGLIGGNGAWQIDGFVYNLADERAQSWMGGSENNKEYQWGRTGEYEHFHRVYTIRPREYGVRFVTWFGD